MYYFANITISYNSFKNNTTITTNRLLQIVFSTLHKIIICFNNKGMNKIIKFH